MSVLDGFASVSLNRDETKMRLLIAGDGSCHANKYRPAKHLLL